MLKDSFCSTQHVSLHRENDNIVIRDLGSKNGTFFKGVRIKQEYVMIGEIYSIGKAQISIDQKRTSPELTSILTPKNKEKTKTKINLYDGNRAQLSKSEMDLKISKQQIQDGKTRVIPSPNFKKLKGLQKKSDENSHKTGTILIKFFEKFLGKK